MKKILLKSSCCENCNNGLIVHKHYRICDIDNKTQYTQDYCNLYTPLIKEST